MSITIRQAFRNSFGTSVPVLTPLYNADCDSWQIADEGEFHCGNNDQCQLPLRLDGIEKQHCSLLFRSGALRIRRNGGRIWVNDLPIASECDLAPGDILNIGPVSFEVSELPRKREIDSPGRQIEKTAAPCPPLDQRAAAIRRREVELDERDEHTSRLRQEVEALRVDLSRQKGSLKAQSLLLSQRSEELDARATELAAGKQALDATESRNRQETQSVERLAATAAEREATIRARHEAFQLKAEARAAKAALDVQESRLQTWQAELDSRHAELSRRVISLKSLREALQNSHKDLLCERNSLVQLSQDLHSREAGLIERERIVGKQAEELRSRFEALAQQTATVQKEETELDARAADLHRRVTQFNSDTRDQESRTRTSPKIAASSDTRIPEVTFGDSARLNQLNDALRETERQRDAAGAERDALFTAVRELQDALQNARSDVEEASRIRAESARHEQTIAELYQTIEGRNSQLQHNACQLQQKLEEIQQLQAQVTRTTLEPDERNRRNPESDSVTQSESGDSVELQLLSQIESLRIELSQSASGDAAHPSEYVDTLAERDQWIHDLQKEVESLRTQLAAATTKSASDAPVDMLDFDRLQARLEKANEVLRDRDDLIRELRSRLLEQAQSAPAEAVNREALEKESRELDRRANLLDERDEELRERCRRIGQSEADIESQRRQLLDARQQLELARAEIQVAMKQHSTVQVNQFPAPPAGMPTMVRSVIARSCEADDFDHAAVTHGSTVIDRPGTGGAEAAHDPGFDLAGLFGRKKNSANPTPGSAVPDAEFLDLSEPAGQTKAVAFRFGDNASDIIQTAPRDSAAEVSAESDRDENSDDFVRDYMEQLLSRSRKSAGNALPNELKPAESRETTDAQTPTARASKPTDAAVAQKQPLKVRSFIEQYMAGGFGDLTGDGSMMLQPESLPEAERPSADADAAEPLHPRVKIDLQKMRENMNSFRSLSTQSVENALVDHAMRTERHKINGRIMFALVLVAMCLFLAIANARGVIDRPELTWVTLVAAIGAATELARKFYGLKARCKGILVSADSDAESDEQVAVLDGGEGTPSVKATGFAE